MRYEMDLSVFSRNLTEILTHPILPIDGRKKRRGKRMLTRRAIILIGEPCVGKSLIMKRYLKRGDWLFVQPKYVPHHVNYRTIVLGRYDDLEHQFPGTDRMSMAAQPHVLRFIKNRTDIRTFIFEGDRLGNISMVKGLIDIGIKPTILKIEVGQLELARRRELERSQSETFLRRTHSKVSRLAETYDDLTECWKNNSLTHQRAIVRRLIDLTI